MSSASFCVGEVEAEKFCSRVDTAQVCLISDVVVDRLSAAGKEFEGIDAENKNVTAIDNSSTEIQYIVFLKIELLGAEMATLPFAVVSQTSMHCCCLLEANFLSVNGLEVDYSSNLLRWKEQPSFSYLLEICLNSQDRNEVNYSFGIEMVDHSSFSGDDLGPSVRYSFLFVGGLCGGNPDGRSRS
jgi:hypothetical protein